MKKLTLKDLEKEGLLLYKYKRGSLAQGTFIEGKSDIDTCSIYISPTEQLLGLGLDYQEDICEGKGDDTAWEFNKFMRLLISSNPTVLEALFVDDEFVDYEHPIITELKKHRDKFITKKCFDAFGGYAVSQIKKCHSLNKKMLQDEEKHIERRTALSFCYTYHNQGSTKIENWLAYRGLLQECCGVTKIPNMRDSYAVYYDWGKHWNIVGYDDPMEALGYYWARKKDESSDETYRDDAKYCLGRYIDDSRVFVARKPIGYRGIFKNEDSSQICLSPVGKNEKPICYMSFNADGFESHCRDYKNFLEWRQNRNPVRYATNKDKNYDAKNVSQAFRLMNMCVEIAKGEGVKVNRSKIDREFLLDVKQHKYEYDEIIEMLDTKKKEMDEAIAQSTLPDNIDVEFVNDFVIKVRKQQLGIDNT